MNRSLVFLIAILCFGCSKEERPAWEYKTISWLTTGPERIGKQALEFSSIVVSDAELNMLGKEGWEVVGTFIECETAFPNFGDEGYHTGIKTNVRPQRVIIILKRLVITKKAK